MSAPRRVLALAALAGLALALPAEASAGEPTSGPSGGDCRDARLAPDKNNPRRVRAAMLCLLNAERRSRGLRPLHASGQLRKAATTHSRKMVRKRFFGHVCPEGSTMQSRIRKGTGYLSHASDWALGENLGWGSGQRSTPRAMVRLWMASAGHRANILDKRFRHVGIGVATGAPAKIGRRRAATYTTDFGYRAKG